MQSFQIHRYGSGSIIKRFVYGTLTEAIQRADREFEGEEVAVYDSSESCLPLVAFRQKSDTMWSEFDAQREW